MELSFLGTKVPWYESSIIHTGDSTQAICCILSHVQKYKTFAYTIPKNSTRLTNIKETNIKGFSGAETFGAVLNRAELIRAETCGAGLDREQPAGCEVELYVKNVQNCKYTLAHLPVLLNSE